MKVKRTKVIKTNEKNKQWKLGINGKFENDRLKNQEKRKSENGLHIIENYREINKENRENVLNKKCEKW